MRRLSRDAPAGHRENRLAQGRRRGDCQRGQPAAAGGEKSGEILAHGRGDEPAERRARRDPRGDAFRKASLPPELRPEGERHLEFRREGAIELLLGNEAEAQGSLARRETRFHRVGDDAGEPLGRHAAMGEEADLGGDRRSARPGAPAGRRLTRPWRRG